MQKKKAVFTMDEKIILYDEEIYQIEDSKVYEIIAKNIYKRRKEKNLSRRLLALTANISEVHLRKIECGMRHPSVPALKRIALALNVEIKTLMETENEEK